MPALSSSPIDPAIGHLAALADDDAEDPLGLLAVLAKVTDPRHRRGIRHRPWREVPVAYTKREHGHGRTERRTLKITAVARGLAFPDAAQAIQITRRRKVKGKWSRETCYAVTSLSVTPGQPRPARRHHPRPLGHRGPAPLGARPGLR
jgi:hypothetical protein